MNYNLTLNTKWCKWRLSFTFYHLQLLTLVAYWIFFGRSEIAVHRYKKWSQSWKSDYKQVCEHYKKLCKKILYLFLTNLLSPVGNLRGLSNCNFLSKPLKLGSLQIFKMVSILKILLKKVCRLLFTFFLRHPVEASYWKPITRKQMNS